ncbi:MAG: PhzF family phenazine biosynthesis protein [Gammaproteobacteria bacterium]|nr:PhzF family phenazine biosynthesis protein [Gammaproteobacteria bacterium]MBU1441022.1 PhzF family phenazine biosynthesis protein [Gammaproteobacteria bacterium]MBU2285746.1 PhzF family phenazine biosynthesis protein [Gammaproteobacteria bacterium]
MRSRPFKQIDVFTATPYAGNPLAVVLDGSDLSDDDMQGFARWTHLSETTFVLPPTEPSADYRVRIFTPGGEMPFAGHPTLGTCHAWLEAGGKPKAPRHIVQQCAAGLITLRRDGTRLAFGAPPLRRSAPSPSLLAKVAAALGLKARQIRAAQLLDNGPVWLGLLLDTPDTVLALQPDHRMLAELGQKVGVAGIHPADESPMPLIARSSREARAFSQSERADIRLEVRAFASPVGVDEDPVTGSLNASLAQWLIDDGQLPESYLAAQGQCLGRAGRVHVTRDAERQVWVGGDSVTCIDGSVVL